MKVSMAAAGSSSKRAMVRYLKFFLRLGNSLGLASFLKRASNAARPKLIAAASAIRKAGISRMPWGSTPASRKPSDSS